MSEFRRILDLYRALCRRGEVGVLGTVVGTSGSAYRGAGARVLIAPDGRSAGLVSGGCLEADLELRAAEVRASGAAMCVEYDSSDDSDPIFGLGLGCGGSVRVLLEPVGRDRPGPLDWLSTWLETEVAGAIATVTHGPSLGRRRVATAQGGVAFDGRPVSQETARGLNEALESERHVHLGEVFVEYVAAPTRLALFGAGPDAEPLVRLGHDLGWRVTVVDHRPAFAKPERFEQARVVLAEPASAVARARITRRTMAVVMSHHFASDRSVLAALLDSPCAYIGVLGARARTLRLLDEIAAAPHAAGGPAPASTGERAGPTAGFDDRVFFPAGLDIGAETPEEIAVSIVAEIQATQRARAGRSLRERPGAIHEARGSR